MKDFIGQTLAKGDYVAYPGGGNGPAEYGLILMRITEVRLDSLQVERLTTYYPNGKMSATVKLRKSTIKKTTKLVKVSPRVEVIDCFENPEAHRLLIGKWVHGVTPIDWLRMK